MTEVPSAYWGAVAFVFGAMVGSFLNVVIWRLPQGKSLTNPPRSYCPHCNRTLTAAENIPLISFLALRARCRTCHQPISWRYFAVELLTAVLFLTMFLRFGPTADAVAYCLFISALIAAFFIDFEHFIIPNEVNTFALLVGIGRDVWGIVHHEPAHALLWGWLPHSILGAMVCAGIFVLIQIIGLALFRKDAMGDGDVKLARAIGAMLPIGQALVSFLLAIAAGAVLGGALLAWQALREKKAATTATSAEGDLDSEEPEVQATPVSLVFAWGLGYIFFVDLLVGLAAFLRIRPAMRAVQAAKEDEAEEDNFVTGPTHIPFGPYMVLGVLLAIFLADPLIQWYLNWTKLSA